MSDTDHAGAWVKGNIYNYEACNRILNDFSIAWKYTMSHLVQKCRKLTLLELFGEDVSTTEWQVSKSECCDVCALESCGNSDVTSKLSILHNAIKVIGEKGEVKLAQWIRGSSLAWTDACDKKAPLYSYSMEHSEMWWRTFMHQCNVLGLVQRELKSIKKQSQHYSVQGLYKVTSQGAEFITNEEKLIIPINKHNKVPSKTNPSRTTQTQTQSSNPPNRRVRKGKGIHGLTVVRQLIECKENWQMITEKADYQFLGVFKSEQNQVIMYTSDCRKVGQSCNKKYHFMWDDIQLSKGTWRDREVKVNLNNDGVQNEETLIYRSAPCNGVKMCPVKGCKYVASITAQRRCPTHSQKLVKSTDMIGSCPVEFGYLYPKNYEDDHRRWILGFVRQQKEPTSNIHNHPVHAAAKMCSKVKECIAEVTSVNPTIKPSDIAKGKGIPFVPSAIDQASAHIGRISREVQRARKATNSGTTWRITDFEMVADEIDE